jgi:hypothetical protein
MLTQLPGGIVASIFAALVDMRDVANLSRTSRFLWSVLREEVLELNAPLTGITCKVAAFFLARRIQRVAVWSHPLRRHCCKCSSSHQGLQPHQVDLRHHRVLDILNFLDVSSSAGTCVHMARRKMARVESLADVRTPPLSCRQQKRAALLRKLQWRFRHLEARTTR